MARPFQLDANIGFRTDHQSNPVCENSCFSRFSGPLNSLSHDPNQPYDNGILAHQKQAFPSSDAIVWSPQFSFAWQPLGVARNLVLRGGVGFFYDQVPASLAANLAYNPPYSTFFNISGYSLAPGEMNSLSQNAMNSNQVFVNAYTNGQSIAQIKKADPNFNPPSFQNPALNNASTNRPRDG